jgi:hypothetical protein
MHRSWPQRVLAVLFAAWFVLAVAEPVPVHACPMHDGLAAPGHSMHSGTPPVHAHHAYHDAVPDNGDRLPSPRNAHQGCTCIGCCAGGSPVVVRSGAEYPQVLVTIDPHVAYSRDSTNPAPTFPHRLPFSNGPPTPPQNA